MRCLFLTDMHTLQSMNHRSVAELLQLKQTPFHSCMPRLNSLLSNLLVGEPNLLIILLVDLVSHFVKDKLASYSTLPPPYF
ncbi:Uncharacterized protein TCM_007519 [Theobroma cacao]|uniref:Uncharacterized protein n=1 Tax=Theobroma cacao TaxID=3641 RepID=A0A061E1C5_THECC|nr:Uncharacterized protein TCM_007519 [Theobroma cacao]